ncbi:MAG: hypothetical protein PWP58_565 [Bacillota bacterium]|nr:hypothetical protein [Bacillota bacterium]
MWLERLKSGLLVLFVALSIYLSLLLWEGMPPVEAPAPDLPTGGTYWGAGRDPISLLAPSRLVFYPGEGAPTLVYPGSSYFQKAWEAALDVLQQLGSLKPEELTGEKRSRREWETAFKGPAVELIFPVAITGDIWGPVLDYPPDFKLPWPVKRVVFLPSRQPALLLVGGGNDEALGLRIPRAPAALTSILEELEKMPRASYRELKPPLPVQAGVYVPAQPVSLPVLRVSGEAVNPEVVAGSFFADLSLTRRIHERDGAIIFSDGRRGVRVAPEGSVEYSAPEVALGGTFLPAQALERAARFVTQHGGWPEEARAAALTPVSTAAGAYWRLAFNQYLEGLPVLTPSIEIELTDRGIGRYRRKVLQEEMHVGWVKVSADKLEEQILSAGRLKKGDRVADAFLAYSIDAGPDGEALLRPVWAVETAAGDEFWLPAEGGDRS